MLVLFCSNGFIVKALHIISTIIYLNTIYPKLFPLLCCWYTANICIITCPQINNRLISTQAVLLISNATHEYGITPAVLTFP